MTELLDGLLNFRTSSILTHPLYSVRLPQLATSSIIERLSELTDLCDDLYSLLHDLY